MTAATRRPLLPLVVAILIGLAVIAVNVGLRSPEPAGETSYAIESPMCARSRDAAASACVVKLPVDSGEVLCAIVHMPRGQIVIAEPAMFIRGRYHETRDAYASCAAGLRRMGIRFTPTQEQVARMRSTRT